MTDFERDLIRKLNVSEQEKVDIKQRVIEDLKTGFQQRVDKECLSKINTNVLTTTTLWLTYEEREDGGVFHFSSYGDKETFKSYEEVEAFVEEVKEEFPSDCIRCYINSWGVKHDVGRDVPLIGLEFYLDLNALMEKNKEE